MRIHVLVKEGTETGIDRCPGLGLHERREAAARFIPLLVDFLAKLNFANASFDWWALSLASKNPLSSPLPRRAFWLWLAREEARKIGAGGELELVTSDGILADALGMLAERAGWSFSLTKVSRRPALKQALNSWTPSGPIAGLVRAFWRRHSARKLCADPRPGPRYAAIYSNIRPDSFDSDGNYRDIFFGDLLPEIRRRGLTPLVFGEIVGGRRTIERCGAHRAFPVIALEHFADGPGLWTIFRRALARRLNGFPLRGSLELDGLELGGLLREELAQNFRESRCFNDLLFYAGASGLFRRVPIETFYLPYENMARDRMLLAAAKEAAPRARVIGYQHTGITPQHLNFRLGKAELPVLPLPQTIVTMSGATRELLAEWGFPQEKLAAGCTLRQAAGAAQRPPRPASKPPRIVVMLATSVFEARAVLDALDSAFAGRPDPPEILVRAHPAMPRVAEFLKARPLPPPYRDGTSKPIAEAWAWADAVIYASSTLGIEAVHRGIPAIFYDIGGVLSVDPGVKIDALKWTVHDGEGLRRAISEIAALSPQQLETARQRGREATERYLRPPSPAALEAFFR